jgi:hypothetical protein
MNFKQILFLIAAILMLVDALGYTFGALSQIHKAIGPKDSYWDKRLFLNLMLANAALYFTAFIAFLGVKIRSYDKTAGNQIMVLCLGFCLYTLVSVLLITPSDWKHAIPRTIAAVLLSIALVIK